MVVNAALGYYDSSGKLVDLVGEGKGGGEGAIFCIKGKPSECVKIYHNNRVTKELQKKILTMVNNRPVDPTWASLKHHSIGWPNAVLYKEPSAKSFAGFTMPFFDRKIFMEAHRYYDQSDRLTMFGGSFTWQHLYTTAFNLASAVGAIHKKNHCVGDLRETNILVGPNALVALVDCDSFQIKDKSTGKTYFTRVGTGEYLPPEYLGASFVQSNLDRYYSDLFALGVLIFKFMMNGVHPYQAKGRLVENAETIEAKIKLGYFPYAHVSTGIKPPLYAPPFKIIPASIQSLFYKCFVEGHRDPGERPSAAEWFHVLRSEKDGFKTCLKNTNHKYLSHLKNCPWCELEEKGGQDIFPCPPAIGTQIIIGTPVALNQSEDQKLKTLLSYIDMALADGCLTDQEKERLIGFGVSLGLSKSRINKLIDDEVKRLKAIVRSNAPQNPLLKVSKTQLSFNNIKANSIVSEIIIISNSGSGTLNWSLTTNKPWIEIKQNPISTSGSHTITIKANTRGFSPGFKDIGKIQIDSNGGSETIHVTISTEGGKLTSSMANVLRSGLLKKKTSTFFKAKFLFIILFLFYIFIVYGIPIVGSYELMQLREQALNWSSNAFKHDIIFNSSLKADFDQTAAFRDQSGQVYLAVILKIHNHTGQDIPLPDLSGSNIKDASGNILEYRQSTVSSSWSMYSPTEIEFDNWITLEPSIDNIIAGENAKIPPTCLTPASIPRGVRFLSGTKEILLFYPHSDKKPYILHLLNTVPREIIIN